MGKGGCYTAAELSSPLLRNPTSSVRVECASATIEFAGDMEKPGVRSEECLPLGLASLRALSWKLPVTVLRGRLSEPRVLLFFVSLVLSRDSGADAMRPASHATRRQTNGAGPKVIRAMIG